MEAQQHRPKGYAYDEVPHQTEMHSSGEDQGTQGTKIGLPTVLDDDPNAPKDRPEEKSPSNYQSKVTDPTGANKEETGTTPLVQSFEKLSVEDKEGKSKSTGKKVPMKEYLAEKFKPREEDKALSEVISGTLFSRQKEKTEGSTERGAKPTGNVVKSEEAAKQKDEHGGSAAVTHGEAGSGKSIMDRLKGATSLWFRKGGKEAQTPNVSNASTEGSAAKEG